MNNEQVIRELRGMLYRDGISQSDVAVICAAIRLLGGNP